ncbi:MAG: DUF3368 domain-containing protein [Hormoscilla sp.]
MIVVAEATPLSELAKVVGQINILRDLFGQVIVSQEVYKEVTVGKHPAAYAVPLATWIEVRSVYDPQKVSDLRTTSYLSWSESATIVLAEELDVDWVLIDDLEARRVANSRKLPVIGTIGILLLAQQRGLLDSVKEVMDALKAEGAAISPRQYQEISAIAQE